MLSHLARMVVTRHPLRTIRQFYDSAVPDDEALRQSDAQAFWSSSLNDPATQDLSHWLGKGRWNDEEKWRSIGETHLQMSRVLRHFASSQDAPRSLVEWGPGGGANLVRFASETKTIYGVDVSEANLDECRRVLETHGFGGFRPILIPAAHPERVLESVTEPVDLFLST